MPPTPDGIELSLVVPDGPLRPAVLSALAAHGEPLRWAITACTPDPASGGRRLTVEAVILRPA
ncbi:hypothetical protein EVJ50_13690 [Synechococcus sp. RSCCF101]|nr:hypothetical protein EVJ50_13690 [Synechococcus sp. RSCCF101]